MRVLQMLSRARTALREGWAEPATRYGAVYLGNYEVAHGRIIGNVSHLDNASRRPPSSIVALQNGAVIGSTSEFTPHERRWRFEIDVEREFDADLVVRGRTEVFAIDRLGSRSPLQMDGATQLGFVRDALGNPSDLELTVNFGKDGNSRNFVRDGWYGQELEHTWTCGTYSTIALPLKSPGSSYNLEMLLWPFVIPGIIDDQLLNVNVSSVFLTRFYCRRGRSFFECEIPPELTQADSLLIQFDHPGAAKPSDFDKEKSDRTLALAFMLMKLRKRGAGPEK
jgi:hypothetical protein